MAYRFTNKIKVECRYKNVTTYLDGYTVPKVGFAFAIVYFNFSEKPRNQSSWMLVNRYSGTIISYSTSKRKRDVETLFDKFSEAVDIEDLEFKNPLSDFNYNEIYSKILSEEFYKKYRINNFIKN